MTKEQALARCEAEQQAMLDHPDVLAEKSPAWLVTLGLEDWEMEKRLIEQEASSLSQQ